MRDERTRFDADPDRRDELARRFLDALREGDVAGLRELLAADVHLVADGGGRPGTRAAVFSAEKAARALAANVAPLVRIGGVLDVRGVNGAPGAVFRDREGRVLGTITLDIRDGRIRTIFAVNNPDKLSHLGPLADLDQILRERKEAFRERR